MAGVEAIESYNPDKGLRNMGMPCDNFHMKTRNGRSAAIYGFAKRFSSLVKGEEDKQIAIKLDSKVSPKSIWNYRHGEAFPSPDVLMAISEVYEVSLDWLLRGQESLFPRDQQEEDILKTFRHARAAGVAEEGVDFFNYLVNKQHRETSEKALRLRFTQIFGLDTIGKRLRHLRESEFGETLEAMAESLNLNPAEYERIERDEIAPGSRMLTALAGRNTTASLGDDVLDWLLEG